VIGVSADSQETQDRFAKSLELPFPLVGDPEGKVREAYGVKWPLFGLARRATFVIGKDRRIRLVHRAERDVESHVTEACQLVGKSA
jgi:thioredoxin-dependent peroxiredoxin